MSKLRQRLRSFFFPASDSSWTIRLLPYAILGFLSLTVLIAGAYAWDYTNSPEFCGTACHTMPPEFTAYLASPHARVDCVECHIGRGFIATRITRKAGDVKHIIATTFKTYEFPIRADDLRPARETCEQCHYPQKFSDDSLREIRRFEDDLSNTPQSTFLTLKTGGGSQREGLGRGIHWHIENKILFLPLDPEQEQIAYVRVEEINGAVREFYDIESGADLGEILPEDLKTMDCTTCHNRITHLVPQPEDTVDQLMARGMISPAIPEIRRKSIEVYSNIAATTEEGIAGIETLDAYYRAVYPEFYADNQTLIEDAIQSLQDAYANSVFPEQKSDWTTHPDHAQHKNSPGCFRCHDGKHLDEEDQAIRLECNLCHSIPIVAGPQDFVARIEISRGPEPETHLNANWISLHRDVFDPTCSNCHSTEDPGGTSNTSFCSNSACHGVEWVFAGFDAPGLREILIEQLPATPEPIDEEQPLTYEALIGPMLEATCGACHGETAMQDLDVTEYESLLAGGQSGPSIVPGDPQGSLLIQVQTKEIAHFGQLTAIELDQVRAWIEAGAP